MSDPSDHGAGHGAHDAAHAHDEFDPEPTQELSPGEPRTPLWLPVLGVFLFVVGAIVFLTSSSADAKTDEPARADAAAVEAPPSPAPAPRPVAPTQQPAQVANALQQLSPQQREDIRKRLDQMRQGVAAGRPLQPSPARPAQPAPARPAPPAPPAH
jgi:hypothetical protein